MNFTNPVKKRVLPFSVSGKSRDRLFEVEIRRGCNTRPGRQPAVDNLYIVDPCISNRHAVVTVCCPSESLQLDSMFVKIKTLGKWSSLHFDTWERPYVRRYGSPKEDSGQTLTLHSGDTFGLVKTTAEFKGWEIVYTKLRYQVTLVPDKSVPDQFYLVMEDITQDSHWSMLMLPTGLNEAFSNLSSQIVMQEKRVATLSQQGTLTEPCSNHNHHRNSIGNMVVMYALGMLTVLILLALSQE